MATTGERIGRLRAGLFVDWQPPRRWALLFLITAVPLVFIAVSGGSISPAAVSGVANPAAYWPLGRVSFEIAPGDARVVRGGKGNMIVDNLLSVAPKIEEGAAMAKDNLHP